jgi:hypothetical protein
VTTRWEAIGGEITATLRESREERLRRARAALDKALDRIAHQPPLRPSGARMLGNTKRVSAAPTVPDRSRAWERGRRDLEQRLAEIVARAPAVYVPAPPATTTTTSLLWSDRDPRRLPVLWSPTPVLGFRAWRMMKTGMNGAVKRWRTPTYAAGCVIGGVERTDDEVPHTNGECADPPCGLYALKDPGEITAKLTPGWNAMGMVALSGKVVEHAIGYRAARATVVAIVVHKHGKLHRFETEGSIARLFKSGEAALGRADTVTKTSRASVEAEMAAYLDEVRLLHEAVGGVAD